MTDFKLEAPNPAGISSVHLWAGLSFPLFTPGLI